MGSRIIKIVKYIIDCIMSVIYGGESKCILCDNYSEEYICNHCGNNMKIIGIEDYVKEKDEKYLYYALGYYSFNIKKLILNFKYHGDFRAGEVLAIYMSEFILSNLKEKIDAITYIPSSEESLKKRGFNQCEVLGKNISERCNLPCLNLLELNHRPKDQIGLDDRKRWENIRDIFSANEGTYISNMRILIIDDVITTGATAFFASRALKKSGVKEVYILTVAKSRV